MFIDLNIPVPAHLDRKEREKLILILYQLSHCMSIFKNEIKELFFIKI